MRDATRCAAFGGREFWPCLQSQAWWTACRLKQAEKTHASQRAKIDQLEQRFAVAKEQIEEARKKGKGTTTARKGTSKGTTKAGQGKLKEAEAHIQAQDATIATLPCASYKQFLEWRAYCAEYLSKVGSRAALRRHPSCHNVRLEQPIPETCRLFG